MAGGRQSPAGSGDRQPGGEWATYTTLRKRWPDGTEFTIRGAGALRGYQLTLTHPVGLKAHSHHRTVEDAKAHADEMMASFPGANSRPKYPVSRYLATDGRVAQ